MAEKTLTVFLSASLTKRYPHPSSDIISILAGLDNIDAVFTDFIGALDSVIRSGKARKALAQLIATKINVDSGQRPCDTRPWRFSWRLLLVHTKLLCSPI
jgi:hypothetical protein